jgi:prepilin-type N-terminal cleavage/methylation domain-containing protein
MRVHLSNGEQGFSLLELVIVIVLISILAVAAMQPILTAFQARSMVATNLSIIDALRYATERIVRELRQTRYDAQSSGFLLVPLDPISGSSNASAGLCFTRVGGDTGSTHTSIAIRASDTLATLDRVAYPGCAAASPQTLADRMASLRFDYWSYGSSGAPVALTLTDSQFGTQLAFIDITLTASANSGSPVSYRSRVVLRNGVWGAPK